MSKKKSEHVVDKVWFIRKVSCNLQNIIAEVLQDAEPIEAKPKPNRRDEIISETIKEYEGIEDPDDKAERIQAAVLEKLKLND